MLKNFEVIEIVKQVAPMVLIIEDNKLRQTRGIVEALEFAPYVRYLMDRKGKQLAIQVTNDKDPQKIKFSRPAAEQGQKATLYQNADMVAVIRGMMPNWQEGVKYQVNGVYSKTDKAVIFDLTAAQEYRRFSEGRRYKKTDDVEGDEE